MYVTELDSFVYKFHQLWKAGITAHLDVDSHAGKAWVGLRVQLGHVPGPAHQHQVHPSFPKISHHIHRGPAYQRRQERRKAAAAAEEAKSSDVLPADEAGNANESVQDAVTEKTEEITNLAEQAVVVENDNEKPMEKAVEAFPCIICDFSSNWKNG